MASMMDMIKPKSDQLNSDDLIAGPMTFRIREVQLKESGEQRCSVFLEGEKNPYKPSKSMMRVMVAAWTKFHDQYAGKSFTLYRNPKIKWGGMEVGGIEISHMSDIKEPMTIALTVTKGSKKMHTVQPLKTNTQQQQRPQATQAPA